MKDFLKRSEWSVTDRLAFLISFIIIAVIVLGPTFGRIEGALYPIGDTFTIDHIQPTDGGKGSNISGTLKIDRTDCDFLRIEWVLVGQTRSVPVDVTFNENLVRESGLQEYGPWHLSIPPEKIKYTRAVAYHQCPFRPWLTVTKLYP